MDTPELPPEFTLDRLAIVAGIYDAVVREVFARRTPFAVATSLGLQRYCEAKEVYTFAPRAYPWLGIESNGLYYHLLVGARPLRVDRLDGHLQPRNGGEIDHANLWLAGIPIPETREPFFRLELDTRGSDADAILRLLTMGPTPTDPESEHARSPVGVRRFDYSELVAWKDLPGDGAPALVDDPIPLNLPGDDLGPAQFRLRKDADEESEGDE